MEHVVQRSVKQLESETTPSTPPDGGGHTFATGEDIEINVGMPMALGKAHLLDKSSPQKLCPQVVGHDGDWRAHPLGDTSFGPVSTAQSG